MTLFVACIDRTLHFIQMNLALISFGLQDPWSHHTANYHRTISNPCHLPHQLEAFVLNSISLITGFSDTTNACCTVKSAEQGSTSLSLLFGWLIYEGSIFLRVSLNESSLMHEVHQMIAGGTGVSCERGGQVCADRNSHVYFDGLHPSEAVNIQIATKAYASNLESEVYPINVKQLAEL